MFTTQVSRSEGVATDVSLRDREFGHGAPLVPAKTDVDIEETAPSGLQEPHFTAGRDGLGDPGSGAGQATVGVGPDMSVLQVHVVHDHVQGAVRDRARRLDDIGDLNVIVVESNFAFEDPRARALRDPRG